MLVLHILFFPFSFFFNDTATTEIYTLSLHDALPISGVPRTRTAASVFATTSSAVTPGATSTSSRPSAVTRSEEHTSELQSQFHLVCRLLLEKKKKKKTTILNTLLSTCATYIISAHKL